MADESVPALIEKATKLLEQHDEIVMELALMTTKGKKVARHVFPRLLDLTHRQMVGILKSKIDGFSDEQKAWLLEHAMEVLALAGIKVDVTTERQMTNSEAS